MDDYKITTMTREEVNTAVDWAAKEGWDPGLSDAECFYRADPTGFFSGKLNGEIISVGSAIRYDDQFGFCGFYIVKPEFRGKGYGIKLTQSRLAYLGERNVGIDGVAEMQDKYKRLGYRIAHKNVRYQGRGGISLSGDDTTITKLSEVDFEKLCEYDRRHFPAARKTFLSHWVRYPGSAGYAILDNGTIKGYGIIRPCIEGYKIGPLFADEPDVAEQIFAKLTQHAEGEFYYLDIPEVNPNAKALVNKHGFKEVFETARMYLRYDPELPLNNIYGITTFELG